MSSYASDDEESWGSSSEGEQETEISIKPTAEEEQQQRAAQEPEIEHKTSSKRKSAANSEEVLKKQKVFIIYGEETSLLLSKDPLIFSLPHPKRGVPARFMLSSGKLLEIQRTICDPSSWFIDNSIQQDGSLYLATPVDPLFVMIPLLITNRKKTEDHSGYFCDFGQLIMSDTTHKGYLHLRTVVTESDLSLICDTKGEMSDTLFRLNDDKLLRWLRCKVERVRTKLSASPSVLPTAKASTFRTSNTNLKPALGFISEYISPSLIEPLAQSYSLANYGAPKVNLLNSLQSLPAANERKHHLEKQDKQTPKKPKLTPAQNKLAKTNLKGVSKIDSFFTKKNP